ncbi:MAG TPA: polyribonucleotide nucleotidyltransferase [Acholeplasmatales bacterium]|jgi:polyribonucleotide nucleotidyltransferase|nr:polyribonucleotide nucleotidyltransferase [Bacilli bacterium]CDD21641.1 polyribonucleotide nucleotidyltransferase [Firmicutes bacterium CAG:313]HCX07675.1 polyribonucleotide nucleotidyltransferase [Acholeplasmatales bacterium]
MEKHVFEYSHRDRKIVVEIGELAKQANGACLVRYNDTAVLSAAVGSNQAMASDFFPLTVLYQEKLYAAGKIPGGFLKREGRATEHETLVSRLIDRPIRPLFAEGYRNEVQVINMVMCANPDYSSAMAAMLGSSIALTISDIPFQGPIAGVVVGRVNGKLVLNPTVEELENSDINLTVAGTKKAINMVEAGAKQVSEDDMLEALLFAHEEIKRLCEFQEEIQKAIGKEKMVPDLFKIPEELEKSIREFAEPELIPAISTHEKLAREAAIEAVNEKTREHFNEIFENDEKLSLQEIEENKKYVDMVLEHILAEEVRRLITNDKIRPDGRAVNEIRPLSSRVDIFERTHGSALFTRGQTQSLSTVTLGSLTEFQIIEGLGVEEGKRFMLHYNFPQFAVGSTGRYGAPGRREIGHGALGERALLQVIPSEDEFPYTIRVVSEILESNGSSSQASICAGTMALMAAGVPIKAPVAGIAMGLISQDDECSKYTILTDIQGLEDHYGDMDFKVAGTRNGITALQMDIKIKGITPEILKEALAQAKLGRMQILDHMMTTISEVRPELSKYAPKVKMIRINPDKIRDVIGSGGKVIQEIIEKCNDVKIDIEQDGRVFVMHSEMEWINKAIEIIENLTREPVVGQIYPVKVVKIVDFGAFVELWPGCEGLVHISELDLKRVAKVEDVVHVGDEIVIKLLKIDDKGKLVLSRKAVLKQNVKPSSEEEKPENTEEKHDTESNTEDSTK